MDDTADYGTPEIADAPVRPKGRPGRKPKGSVPVVIPETPDKPDPNHVLTLRQRKVLQVIRESVQQRGYPPSMREIGEADLAHRGRVTALLNRFPDYLQHLALPQGQHVIGVGLVRGFRNDDRH